jgi:hypothetical protein
MIYILASVARAQSVPWPLVTVAGIGISNGASSYSFPDPQKSNSVALHAFPIKAPKGTVSRDGDLR